ncbi:hypothetical protein LMG27174_03747 [Paraburkholderia rhynchosiae]|uniref:Uncharacterized protein n=1 Tax=Paraburkholderia rhynchosiae TaxID=487049 RepID=A0A6J5BFL0_9BURK|nr:hypothetical protein LMG27174_03747 [Paraburkholderia rhynchosiae]
MLFWYLCVPPVAHCTASHSCDVEDALGLAGTRRAGKRLHNHNGGLMEKQ